jgi:dihydroorotate dehydrogenase (fumarate)
MSIDFTTDYLGLRLKNPIVVAPCPLTRSMASIRRLEAAGAAAVVLQSVFAEQIELDELESLRDNPYAGETTYIEPGIHDPGLKDYNYGAELHLDFLQDVKREVALPVIVSLNATTAGRWIQFARQFELAGADALEINLYAVPTDPSATARDVEDSYVKAVAEVAKLVTIPFAVKIGPFFTALPNFAARLVAAGASGLVLFNRYLEPDLDLQSLRIQPHLDLSHTHEHRLVLRWIGILRDQLDCSLAATSGIHSAEQVIKSLLVGANATMLASTLLEHGPERLSAILRDMEKWFAEHRLESVSQMVGSLSRQKSADSHAFERANYIKALVGYVTGKQAQDRARQSKV